MSNTHLYIITGTSRGIGEGLAKALLKAGNHLICISRTPNDELIEMAKSKGIDLNYLSLDLADPEGVIETFADLLEMLNPENFASINLVHNAGSLEPIAAIGKEKDLARIDHSLTVNLTTPMLTTEIFVSATQDWEIEKKVLMVSSGAAVKAYHAWSAYCTAKAGLEMFTQCLSLEQESETYPIKAVSLAPGVVDTAMQDFLRTLTEETFHQVGRFKALKTEGKLWSPDFVGEKMAELLESNDFGSTVRLDLRDLVEQ